MLHETNMAKYFSEEDVKIACYVHNRIYTRPILNKKTYELFKGRKLSITYFHQFCCTCYIMNNKVYLTKFDVKTHKCIFLGYSERSKAYNVYSTETKLEKNLYTSDLMTKSLIVNVRAVWNLCRNTSIWRCTIIYTRVWTCHRSFRTSQFIWLTRYICSSWSKFESWGFWWKSQWWFRISCSIQKNLQI